MTLVHNILSGGEHYLSSAWTLSLVLSITIFTWYRSKLTRNKQISPIPGITVVPGAHWLFGHLKIMLGPLKVGDIDWFDHLFVHHANEQGLCCAYYLNNPAISVLSAKHARIVLRQGSARSVPTIVTRHARRTLGQKSIIMLSGRGSDWKRQRGLLQYALTADAIKEHNSIIREVANSMVEVLTKLCKKESDDGTSVEVDVVNIAQSFTLEAFGKLALGHDFHCFSDSAANGLKEADAFAFLANDIPVRMKATWNPFLQFYWIPTAYNKRYKVERDITEKLLRKVIEQSKDLLASDDNVVHDGSNSKKKNRDNMLTHIIRRSGDESTNELIDKMKTILFAGYETTAITITYALFNLSKYPEIQEECCKEARRILQREDNSNISDLRYTRACLLESMRLTPTVINTSRNLQKTIKLDDFVIPAGTRMVVPLPKVLTDERNFERAKQYIPTRWVRWSEATNEWIERDHTKEPKDHGMIVAAADPANFLAFSDGARDCVGKRLAINESLSALSYIMKHFKVEYDATKPIKPRRRLTSWFPHDLQIKFVLRDDVE